MRYQQLPGLGHYGGFSGTTLKRFTMIPRALPAKRSVQEILKNRAATILGYCPALAYRL